MSQRSKRSARQVYTHFDEAKGIDQYTAANLESFIREAGPEYWKDYNVQRKNYTDDNLERYAEILDMDVADPTLKRRIATSSKTASTYKRELKELRWEFVTDLNRRGLLKDLPSASIASSKGKFINKDQIENIYNKDGVDAIIELFKARPPSGFRTNALEQLASLMDIPSSALDTVPRVGDERRAGLINAILVHQGEPSLHDVARVASTRAASRGRSPTVAPKEPREVIDTLRQHNILDSLSMYNLQVSELNRVARSVGVIPGSNKTETINRIAKAGGLLPAPTLADITARYNDVISAARTNVKRAERLLLDQNDGLRAEELNLLDAKQIQALYDALSLKSRYPNEFKSRGRPSKIAIIEFVTRDRQDQTGLSITESRRRRTSIRTNRESCSAADFNQVKDVANTLRISYNDYSTKEEICDDIYLYHLRRVSDLLLNNVEELPKLESLDDKVRRGRLAVIASNAGLDIRPTSVAELLDVWINSHYKSRAMRFFPGAIQTTEAYLQDGTVPSDAMEQRRLARVFSDIRPDIETLPDYQLEDQLQALYDRFVGKVKEGDVATMASGLRQYTHGRKANGSPRRSVAQRSARRVQRNASPQRSPAQSVAQRNASPQRSARRVQRNASPQRSPAQSVVQDLSRAAQRNASPQRSPAQSVVQDLSRAAQSVVQRNASPQRSPTQSSATGGLEGFL